MSVIATEAYFATDDTVLFTLVVRAEDAKRTITRDAFILRDGRIIRQIAMTLPPEKDRMLCSYPAGWDVVVYLLGCCRV